MSPLLSDLMVTLGGIIPLVALVILCLRRERKLSRDRAANSAQ